MRWSIVGFLAVLAAGARVLEARPVARGLPRSGKVVEVIDGDTIVVEAKRIRYECRLLGIDTPELSYKFLWRETAKLLKYTSGRPKRELERAEEVFRKWAKVMERLARQAREALSGMIKRKAVELTYDRKEGPRDKYDRLLVYVSVRGKDVNAEMIRRGLAVADARFPADRLRRYLQLSRKAKSARIGLWRMQRRDWEPPPESEVEVWVSLKSEKYHLPDCRWAKGIKPENLIKFPSVQQARDAGYLPCQTCKPPEK